MNAIAHFVVQHGYSILFAAVFARQIGLPVPANLFVLAAGAIAASGKLALPPVVILAVVGCVLADWAWYEAGRVGGQRVLHFIHRLTPSPEVHDRRAKSTFARYGPPILLFSKFIPGLDLVAPPLAGVSRTSRLRFLTFETLGAALWSSAYAGLGHVFSHDLKHAAVYAGRVGWFVTALAITGLFAYAMYKLIQRHRGKRESKVPETSSLECDLAAGLMVTPSAIVRGFNHGD
jgi:membrane protein DedA with SNARE-associated domain